MADVRVLRSFTAVTESERERELDELAERIRRSRPAPRTTTSPD
jgi:hypothetical protein